MDLSCSHCRVLSLSLWQGLRAELSQGRHPKMVHWSEASPRAARYRWSWGDKLLGEDEIHLQTLQHPGLGAGTMNCHGKTPRNMFTNLDLTRGAPSAGRVELCPYICVCPGRAHHRAHFQTSITWPVSLLKPKWDLPHLRPTNYLTSLGGKKKRRKRKEVFFSSENTHSNYHWLSCYFFFKKPPFKRFCWIFV